ncbi:hypothetical protein [Kribbella sp. NPDC051620]|uniref:hypothetical protein n=1 Tax=Kribbella sp. NPDC051620 TaxID=3364120 RepID=UPI0037A5BA00
MLIEWSDGGRARSREGQPAGRVEPAGRLGEVTEEADFDFGLQLYLNGVEGFIDRA